jgi:uncharacterized membrane protein YjjB (DUF3815 family)
MNTLWLFFEDAAWAALAGLGFAMVFNVPRHLLLMAVGAGAIGHAVRAVLVHWGMNLPAASLAAGVVIGFWAVFWARRTDSPAQIFSIPGVIPMIPGKFAYLTMIGLIQWAIGKDLPVEQIQHTLHNMMMTALILGGLASGIATPQLLFMRRHSVV